MTQGASLEMVAPMPMAMGRGRRERQRRAAALVAVARVRQHLIMAPGSAMGCYSAPILRVLTTQRSARGLSSAERCEVTWK